MTGCGCGASGYKMERDTAKLDCGCGCGGLKKSDALKVKTSLQSAILFFIIANPFTYKLMTKLLGNWVGGECPSPAGLVLHSVVFGLVVFLLMKITLHTPH